MFRPIWKLYLSANRWKIIGEIPDSLKKYIVIVAPHTSNWDFPLGLAVRSVIRMKAKFLGKKELFRFPFGVIVRLIGGYPVDRSKSHHLVDAVVDIFDSHDEFSIAIAPEGTRKKVERLKTGFYHIAVKAKVPIIMCGFDYRRHEVIFSESFYPSGELEKDLPRIFDFYRNLQGKNPELGFAHQ